MILLLHYVRLLIIITQAIDTILNIFQIFLSLLQFWWLLLICPQVQRFFFFSLQIIIRPSQCITDFITLQNLYLILFFLSFHFIYFFPFIFISWRLITLQYCSGFCHTLTWISHGFTCVPHPDPLSHLPLHPIPLGLPSAPGLSSLHYSFLLKYFP